MANWAISKDFHTSGAISVHEYRGVPILVAHTGRYPAAECEDGRSTKQVPHILISVCGGSSGSKRFFNSVSVTAQGAIKFGRNRVLRVAAAKGEDTDTPDTWIAWALEYLDRAVDVLDTLDATYDAASARLTPLANYKMPLARKDYEAACLACDVKPFTDLECDGYGVRFGDFSFPEYSTEQIISMALARHRLQQIDAEAAAAAKVSATAVASVPRKTGQLWEPCQCGVEPVYMPLHLCDKCWPIIASA